MTYAIDDRETIKQDLAMDEANIQAGIKQMLDMCEWLEMESSVSYNWREWVGGYDECPVDDHHLLSGDHKALFVQMINLCPDFDACLDAWKDYSVVTSDYIFSKNLLQVSAYDNGNIFLRGEYEGFPVIVEIRPDKNFKSYFPVSMERMASQELDGMAVWVNGELDFMYGYPNLGPNGYMVATPTP